MFLYAPQMTLTQSVRVFLLPPCSAGIFSVSATQCNASVHILTKRKTAPAQHANIQYLPGSHHFCDRPRKAEKMVNKIHSIFLPLKYITPDNRNVGKIFFIKALCENISSLLFSVMKCNDHFELKFLHLPTGDGVRH
jgi:hypothetical protein